MTSGPVELKHYETLTFGHSRQHNPSIHGHTLYLRIGSCTNIIEIKIAYEQKHLTKIKMKNIILPRHIAYFLSKLLK